MAVSGCIALRNAFKKSNPYRVEMKEKGSLRPDLGLSRNIYRISLPAMLERLCLSSAACLRVEASIQVPQVIGWIYSGALRGAGDTGVIFYINAATNWGIRTLGMLLGIRLFGLQLEQAYIVVAVEITVRMVLFYFRYRSGRWKTVMQRMEKKSVVKS